MFLQGRGLRIFVMRADGSNKRQITSAIAAPRTAIRRGRLTGATSSAFDAQRQRFELIPALFSDGGNIITKSRTS